MRSSQSAAASRSTPSTRNAAPTRAEGALSIQHKRLCARPFRRRRLALCSSRHRSYPSPLELRCNASARSLIPAQGSGLVRQEFMDTPDVSMISMPDEIASQDSITRSGCPDHPVRSPASASWRVVCCGWTTQADSQMVRSAPSPSINISA